ncbi:MAG TPA: VWA domain-containing protein [Pyrinomonadaceae bacterium]|nr:VWA domain-containing protein [Pyrinomonadaceae bacterium]
MRRTLFIILGLTLLISAAAIAPAQTAKPSPTPTPEDKEGQDPVKVFTEEVRLPVVATDNAGHLDAGLEIDDVLVLEDGKPQQIRSVRHIPANVLLLVDTGGGDLGGVGGMAKKTSLTRDVALRVLSLMRKGDAIALLQSGDRPDVLQTWTDDRNQVAQILKWKLFSAKRSRIFESMVKAAELLSDRPEGSRHVVLITDGVQTPGGKIQFADAVKQLTAARATIHIISYTTLVRQKDPNQKSNVTIGQRPNSENPVVAHDPTLPPGSTRSPSFGVAIRFDPAMKRRRKAYEAEAVNSEKWLTELAAETGGSIFLPMAPEEMLAKAENVAREIGAEFVVTYRPTKPLAEAKPGEYRQIEVASRRVGLYLRSRRGYFVPEQK